MNRTYPNRLQHRIPAWVSDVAIFHIRIRCSPGNPQDLTNPEWAQPLLASVEDYAVRGRWSCFLFLLMPDHLHALFSFASDPGMSETLRNWKRAQARLLGIRWQSNYFDHRIRSAAEYSEKFSYIERNPVAKGLCVHPGDWPWRMTWLGADVVPPGR